MTRVPVVKAFVLRFHIPVDFTVWVEPLHSVTPHFYRKRPFRRIFHELVRDLHVKLLCDKIKKKTRKKKEEKQEGF